MSDTWLFYFYKTFTQNLKARINATGITTIPCAKIDPSNSDGYKNKESTAIFFHKHLLRIFLNFF